MKETGFWQKAQSAKLQIGKNILPEFNIGFDKRIPKETEEELRSFVHWMERNFSIPITLWVDFEYKHYLIDRGGKRVGYLFHWADFSDYPTFDNPEDIPQIRLPVRTEHSTLEEILTSFIQAISCYYAWICNQMDEGYESNQNDTEEILRLYLSSKE